MKQKILQLDQQFFIAISVAILCFLWSYSDNFVGGKIWLAGYWVLLIIWCYLISRAIKNKKELFFNINSNGVVTSRDAWVYNFSKPKLSDNMKRTISFYEEQLEVFRPEKEKDVYLEISGKSFINTVPGATYFVEVEEDPEEAGKEKTGIA